jgi:hypothetical protein
MPEPGGYNVRFDRKLVVYSVHSAPSDAAAHSAQANLWLPLLLDGHVRPLLTNHGPTGFAVLQVAAPVRRAALAELLGSITSGELRALVHRFALADASAAHRALESRAAVGERTGRGRDNSGPLSTKSGGRCAVTPTSGSAILEPHAKGAGARRAVRD